MSIDTMVDDMLFTPLGKALVGMFLLPSENFKMFKNFDSLSPEEQEKVYPTKEEILKIRKNLDDLVEGLRRGDTSAFVNALLRSPKEVKEIMRKHTLNNACLNYLQKERPDLYVVIQEAIEKTRASKKRKKK